MSRIVSARQLIEYTNVDNLTRVDRRTFDGIVECIKIGHCSKGQLDALQGIYRRSVGGGDHERRQRV